MSLQTIVYGTMQSNETNEFISTHIFPDADTARTPLIDDGTPCEPNSEEPIVCGRARAYERWSHPSSECARPAAAPERDGRRTRVHERAAFGATGCIGIILRQQWNHASMMDRAQHSVLWWETWVRTVAEAKPGSMWQCPWNSKPKPLKPFKRG
jgi:hypothetical protein